MRIKVNFEDKGQDLLFLIINNDSKKVESAGPLNDKYYKESLVITNLIEKGKRVQLLMGNHSLRTIKFLVTEVETLDLADL